MRKKRILWLSQHTPLAVQIARLEQLFGPVEIRQDVHSFKSADEIKERYDTGGYDDLVAVAPWSVLNKLCELGIRPLWAEMVEVKERSEADLNYRGRLYKFNRFRRLVKFEPVFEEVG